MKIEYLYTRLSGGTRFINAFACYVIAAFLHTFAFSGGETRPPYIITGFFFLAVPFWLLAVKSFPPAKAAGDAPDETWLPVTMTELDRVRDKLKNMRKIKIPFRYTIPFGIVFTFFFLWAVIPIGTIFGARRGLAFLDLYLILVPFIWFARIREPFPRQLADKLDALSPVLNAGIPASLKLSAMMIPGADADEAPRDIRLMLEPGAGTKEEIRAELLGAQFQVTFNKGPKGIVPYVYAVFITKGRGEVWRQLCKSARHSRYISEADSSDDSGAEYGTIVVRLDTESRSDGYHTTRGDVEELFDITAAALAGVVSPP